MAICWLRSMKAEVSRLEGDKALYDDVLDWPHAPFRLSGDPNLFNQPMQPSCSVLDCLPPFAFQMRLHDKPWLVAYLTTCVRT